MLFSGFPLTLFKKTIIANQMNAEKCVFRHAREDRILEKACMQSASDANHAYSSALRVYNPVISMLFTLIFSLCLILISLKKQIDELKEKIDV